ncbi:MAG: DNA replication/repair protein RecF [Saprospiraceae bacterium]
MWLTKMTLTHFKNHTHRSFAFSSGLNGLTGLNGVGKTNVLEAIYCLCMGRSYSGLTDKQLIEHGEAFFRLEGQFNRLDEQEHMVIKFPVNLRKVLERNGQPLTRLSQHIGRYPVVMIAPDDVALVQDGSEDRRRFMDTALAQTDPAYLLALTRYQQALKQRNALLKQFADQRRFDAPLLESVDQLLPEPALLIHRCREAFVADLLPVFQELYGLLSGGRENAHIAYASDLSGADMQTLLKERLEKDRFLERTTAGIHRDDLDFQLDGQAVKKFGSQGQLKSFLLALRLAQYELLRRDSGLAPILLLDDVFDKLDAARVTQLVALLIGRGYGQVFMTDTHRERLEGVMGSGQSYTVLSLLTALE